MRLRCRSVGYHPVTQEGSFYPITLSYLRRHSSSCTSVSATTQLPANDTLQAVHGALLSAKPVRLDGAFLTARQVHAFCDHLEVLLRSRVFTLLTDPQSIMAISLRFITSKVMARVPVADWKEVSTIIEALRECYPLTADDSFVSTYDK